MGGSETADCDILTYFCEPELIPILTESDEIKFTPTILDMITEELAAKRVKQARSPLEDVPETGEIIGPEDRFARGIGPADMRRGLRDLLQ